LDVQLNFTLFATEANFTGNEANFATFGPCNPCLDIEKAGRLVVDAASSRCAGSTIGAPCLPAHAGPFARSCAPLASPWREPSGARFTEPSHTERAWGPAMAAGPRRRSRPVCGKSCQAPTPATACGITAHARLRRAPPHRGLWPLFFGLWSVCFPPFVAQQFRSDHSKRRRQNLLGFLHLDTNSSRVQNKA